MNTKVKDEIIATIRSVVGQDYSEMDIIRALHMSNNDATGAINIIFDTPNLISKPQFRPNPRINSTQRVRVPSSTVIKIEDSDMKCDTLGELGCGKMVVFSGDESVKMDLSETRVSKGEEWWFVGYGEISGMSTSKGRKIKAGDEVEFALPAKKTPSPSSTGKGFGRGKLMAGCSEIVRFSTRHGGEVGRIPNEWARCLIPLVRDKKIQVDGFCKHAPENLSIMDTIALNVSVYINSSMFRKHHQNSLKAATNVNDESVVHPLPTLFKLLGLAPSKKAQFTPDNLYTRKRPLNTKDGAALHASLLHTQNSGKVTDGDKSEGEETISDADVDRIVGVGDTSKLEEMDPPITLQCELRPYQKQALHWMAHLEKGLTSDEAATTLHPCWEAYQLADKRGLSVYLNSFSGEVTIEFPSTLQMARGGILADAMGLGKTVMTISLLLANPERTGSPSGQLSSQVCGDSTKINETMDASPNACKTVSKFQGFDKLTRQNNILISGGTLILCPMTLLSQWKAEIETHS